MTGGEKWRAALFVLSPWMAAAIIAIGIVLLAGTMMSGVTP